MTVILEKKGKCGLLMFAADVLYSEVKCGNFLKAGLGP